jgi:hypothetical protein
VYFFGFFSCLSVWLCVCVTLSVSLCLFLSQYLCVCHCLLFFRLSLCRCPSLCVFRRLYLFEERDAHIVDFVGSLLKYRLCVCLSLLSLCLSVCLPLCRICVYEREHRRAHVTTHRERERETHTHVYASTTCLHVFVCVCVCVLCWSGAHRYREIHVSLPTNSSTYVTHTRTPHAFYTCR